MGDRYCVGFTGFRDDDIENPERRVWLYSHWGGDARHSEIATAIEKARPRWSDPTYATRIAISTIVADGWKEETGFGIEAGPRCLTGVEYGAILVDWSAKTVTEFAYGGWVKDETDEAIATVTPFDEFTAKHAALEGAK